MDIRVNTSLTRHWKYKKLRRIIGMSPMELLVTFWSTVAEQIPNGALNGWSTDDVEDAAGWSGEPGIFCQGLLDSGFLDVTENGCSPHDWEEHQPWVIGAKERSEAARIAGLASAEARKRKKGISTDNQRGVNEALNGALNEPLTDGQREDNPKNEPATPSPSPSPSLKEEEKEKILSTDAGQPALLPQDDLVRIPYQDIIGAYNKFCPSLSKATELSASRKNAIRLRWMKYQRHPTGPVNVFDTLFKRAEASDFITGRDGKWAGKRGIDWLLNEANMVKVLEGNYDNDKGKTRASPHANNRTESNINAAMKAASLLGIGNGTE